ncbi:SUMF1/EgtB/PvdO family nonheme iron enzyme [Gemmatimonadota bacterium]
MSILKRLTIFITCLACWTLGQANAQYIEDYNSDGKVNVADVIFLLILAKNKPDNPRLDYNQDGKYNIVDPVALLLSIRDGILTPVSEPGPDTTLIQEIDMLDIPGGTFLMGSDFGFPDESPAHTVELDSFRISRTEITNSQYAVYLNAALKNGDIITTRDSIIGASGEYTGKIYLEISGMDNFYNRCWITYGGGTFKVEPGKETWPVVFVSWYGAYAFAEYCGLSLPTEAEWEYASRGGRQYKYGTANGSIEYGLANYNLSVGYPEPVGSYASNPYGLKDMAGNVREWCNDWFNTSYYNHSPECNPQGPESGYGRAARGGGFNHPFYICRSAKRSYHVPDHRISYLGFRVVRRP